MEMPLVPEAEIESSYHHNKNASRAGRSDSHHSSTTANVYQMQPWAITCQSLNLQNLRPFMILPVTGSVQAEAMCFFEYISIKHLNEYQPCERWRNILMFFSQTMPSVRYAATALALAYRNYLDRNPRDGMRIPHPSEDSLPDKVALLHYNQAIKLLLNQETDDHNKTTAITLLVCYLFICFDHLAGNYRQAIKHLSGGVELLRNVDKALPCHADLHDDAESSCVRALIYHVTRQIRRLDIQAAVFLVDWTPANFQETLMSQPLPSDTAFRSFDQAADYLQILVSHVMRLRHTEQKMSPTGRIPTPPSSLIAIVLGRLDTWSSLFDNMLQQNSCYERDSGIRPLISLLRLRHTISCILIRSYGSSGQMDYDCFLPQFQQCVALARDVATAHEWYSGSLTRTFTPEIGIISVLYIIGVKCRHPVVRREVLSILRRQAMREAVWDSICIARVVERVIEIEEGGYGKKEIPLNMEQIGLWERIETLSWVQSAARVDISYTLCTQEDLHIESLTL